MPKRLERLPEMNRKPDRNPLKEEGGRGHIYGKSNRVFGIQTRVFYFECPEASILRVYFEMSSYIFELPKGEFPLHGLPQVRWQ